MAADRPASCERVWLLARRREDRRRVLSGISVVLEHRGLLLVRAANPDVGIGIADCRLRRADVRTHAVRLLDARRAAREDDERRCGALFHDDRIRTAWACGAIEDRGIGIADLSGALSR